MIIVPVVRPGAERVREGLSSALSVSDPGLVRLRSAATTLGTLAVTLVVLVAVMSVWGQATTSALLGVVVAMMSSMSVAGPSQRQRAVTTALLVPSAAIAVTLAVLLQSPAWAGDVAFVAVMVAAVFLRMLGARGGAMGMVAFMSYFFALFLKATAAQIPALIVAASVGAVVSFLAGALTRSRHPDRALRRVVGAWGGRAAKVVAALAAAVASADDGPRTRRRMRRLLTRCREASVIVEQQVTTDGLAVRVVDVQLTVERVAMLAGALPARGGVSEQTRQAAAQVLGELAGILRARRDPQAELSAQEPPSAADEALAPLMRASQRCAAAWGALGADASGVRAGVRGDGSHDADDADDAADTDASVAAGPRPPVRPTLQTTLKQAAQVALAGSAAIVVGEALSPDRWFWAVITAFVVFTGTSTREEILAKGWQRVLGTVAGVVVGVVVATLVGDHSAIALVLMAVCLFLGFYWVKVSPGAMIFFITTVLALLYGLLGEFSVSLLVLRLEETTAGAVIGILASYLVFPSGTRSATRRSIVGVLDSLTEQLEVAGAWLCGTRQDAAVRLPATSRALREALTTLGTTAKPLVQGLGGPAQRAGTRRAVLVMSACEHHALALGRVAQRLASAGVGLDAATVRLAVPALDAVQATVTTVRDGFTDDADVRAVVLAPAEAQLDALDAALAAYHRQGGREGTVAMAITLHLRAIDEALRRMVEGLGGRVAPPGDGGGAGAGAPDAPDAPGADRALAAS